MTIINTVKPNYQFNFKSTENKEETGKKSIPLPVAVTGTGTILGGGTGLAMGLKHNPFLSFSKDIKNSFAKEVYSSFLNKPSNAAEKEFYESSLEILKQINNTKNPDELKVLLNNHPNVANSLSLAIDFNNIDNNNFKQIRKIIKDTLKNINNAKLTATKVGIVQCMVDKKPDFKKVDNINDDLFNSIKEVAKKIRTKSILLYAAVSAGIGAVLGLVASALIMEARFKSKELKE